MTQPRLSRRRFLVLLMQLPIVMGVWGKGVPRLFSQHPQQGVTNNSSQVGYGQGGYGEGAYPAGSEHSTYLPIITHKEN